MLTGWARFQSREVKSYTPKHLAEKILTSKSALEGERKVIVLFADLNLSWVAGVTNWGGCYLSSLQGNCRGLLSGGGTGRWQAPNLTLVAQLAARVPGELALRLRRFCQETGQSFNQTVAEALEKYLAKKKR